MGCQSRVRVVSIAAAGLSALAVVVWAPRAAAQALTCGADVSFTYDPPGETFLVGDVVTVVVTLDAGSIEGGTAATFNHIEFELDCNSNDPLSHPCTDETQKVTYLGDATISETCPGNWVSDVPAGGAADNTLTFTSDAAVTLAEDTTCTFSFDVQILESSADATPGIIEQVAHTVATCNNGLQQPDIDVGALQVSDCQVAIDKTVNVEEPENWVDSAVTVDGQPADFRLVVSAEGGGGFVGLQNCVVTDPDLDPVNPVGTIAAIAAGGSETIIVPGFCDVDGTRTNTASVTCECADHPEITRTDSDTATLQCLTPGVDITKTCVEPTDGGPFTFDIDVTNTGETALRCTVTDHLEPGACPQAPEGTADFTSTAFVVAPGGTAPVDFGPQTVSETSCNVAAVTCEIGSMDGETFVPEADDCINVVEGAGTCAVNGGTCATDADCGTKTVTDTASEECTVAGEGCLTRTPGFWGTHPNVTAEFLDVWSCGHTLGETAAGVEGSATEDLCSIGRDKGEYDSPQQAQLTRQCAAAALNIAASAELGGSCEEELSFARFSECCGVELCAEGTKDEITASGCIEDLDAFNNAELGEFDDQELCHVLELGPPCAADPSQCQIAGDNGFINTVVTPAPGATLSVADPGAPSGGCASGSAGALAVLGLAALIPRLRRRRA